MREFESGATRDDATDKLDFRGFLSIQVLRRYARYMHKHRKQADGQLRDSDNWKHGIPQKAYLESAWRHFLDWAELADTEDPPSAEVQEAACALLFNIMGWLHEEMHECGSREAEDIAAAQVRLDEATQYEDEVPF
jgi:hypothetical protein